MVMVNERCGRREKILKGKKINIEVTHFIKSVIVQVLSCLFYASCLTNTAVMSALGFLWNLSLPPLLAFLM